MVTSEGRKRLPPYVSYRTFRNFIDGMRQAIPARIDRSYWGDQWSGSNGTQAVAALRFMGLIDNNLAPTNRLRQLVQADSVVRTGILQQLANENFAFVLKSNGIDPKTATFSQLEESFRNNYQLTGDLLRKCTKFFIEMATDAGIPLSQHIVKKSGMSHAGVGIKRTIKKMHGRTKRNLIIPQSMEEIPDQMSWDKMLLSKFPSFDPSWTDEVKLQWFQAFDELLKRRTAGAA